MLLNNIYFIFHILRYIRTTKCVEQSVILEKNKIKMDHIGRCGWGLKIYAYLQIFENKHYLKYYCSNFCDKLKYNFSEYCCYYYYYYRQNKIQKCIYV